MTRGTKKFGEVKKKKECLSPKTKDSTLKTMSTITECNPFDY